MTWRGLPQAVGLDEYGYCAHCGGNPRWIESGSFGTFCCSCCRWCTYHGPVQDWGDGMAATVAPIERRRRWAG